MNGELHVGLDTTDFLLVFPLKGERTRAAHRHGARRSRRSARKPVVERRQSARDRVDAHRRRARELVLDLPRAPSGRRSFPQGSCVPARRRRAHPQSGGWTGHEHRHRRCGEPRLETRGRPARRANASLLDSYEPERIAFARRLVATTDQAFTGVTSHGAFARLMRLRIVPLLFPFLFKLATVRRLMFRTVSQTAVNYRGSSLSKGRAGTVHGGDRLPWVKTDLERRMPPTTSRR